MNVSRLGAALRRGWWVAVALVVLTAVDYMIPVWVPHGNLPILLVFALVEAAVVFYYFMHVAQLWRQHPEE
ncbi:MAG: hypothetical protein HY681_02480 [Chloroflexi bacterium]|nr:hypothetical protein [Chloroflexota bacterium]